MVRLRMVNRLVAQMADRTIRIGTRMMVRDAAQNHHEHQQRKERYWNDEIPSCSVFMHATKVGRTPAAYHIRRRLSDANGLRWEHLKAAGPARVHLAAGSRRFFRA
jgi:hypothetical protein